MRSIFSRDVAVSQRRSLDVRASFLPEIYLSIYLSICLTHLRERAVLRTGHRLHIDGSVRVRERLYVHEHVCGTDARRACERLDPAVPAT